MMYRASPIASIGRVNLLTAKVAKAGWHDWSTVFDCWESGGGTNMLMQDRETLKYRIVHTSGDQGDPIGRELDLCDDQSRRRIGSFSGWKVVAVAKHDADGLKELAKICGPSCVMATYK